MGALQVILGVSMIFPIIVQIIYGELNGSFISSGLIAIIIGILFILSNRSVGGNKKSTNTDSSVNEIVGVVKKSIQFFII